MDVGGANVTYVPVCAGESTTSLHHQRSRGVSASEWALLGAMGAAGTAPRRGPPGRFLTMHKRRRKKLITRSLQDHHILDDVHHGMVQKILDRCGAWAFNAFTLETVAGGRSLPVLCVHLFHWYGLLDHFGLDVVRVWKLFTLIEEGYHSTNPYHNSIHATDVTQAMHCFLQEEKIRQHVTPLEVMASLIGAVAHDLDHPGVNQHFLITTSNHLAVLYQNMSVLENHHWRSAVGCLLESGVAEQLLPYRNELEQQIRDLILATDINRQPEFLSKFKKHLDEGTLDLRKASDRQFILQIALKCADISNPTRPWDISHKWSVKVCDEFFRQGEYERKLNLPVTSICDRQSTSVAKIQVGFFRFVVTPLFSEWHRFLRSPLSTHMSALLDANRRRWEAQEQAEQAEETQTELSDADDAATNDVSEGSDEPTKRSSETTTSLADFIPPVVPPSVGLVARETVCRRQSLAVPRLECLGVRRHSVPMNMEGQSTPVSMPPPQLPPSRTVFRRESLPTSVRTSGRSPVSPQTESRASSGLREEDELLRYGSHSDDSSGSPQFSSEEIGERPLSAETLLPEPSITSMTSSEAVGRLASQLAGGVSAPPPSKHLTRQQTFPPPQPYVRMRYMSATVEMTTCPETPHEGDSRSTSSHCSREDISGACAMSSRPPVVPAIAVLSPSNGRPPDLEFQQQPSRGKREPEATTATAPKMARLSEGAGGDQRGEKENVDPRKLLSATILTRRRGSAPVFVATGDVAPPAGGGPLHPSHSAHALRRGSFPIEIAHYYSPDEHRERQQALPPVEATYGGPRRGSAPTPASAAPRHPALTRHVSLNGRSGGRGKKLRDAMQLARRRGSLPIEVLTVGHSVF